MPSYSDFRALVRDWSNKDSSVLSDARINDCMRYAADNSYRRLRISALEQTVTYSQTQLEAATTTSSNVTSKTELTIPADLLEFIQLREIDDDGNTSRVFNEKTDLRTFNDVWALKTQASYWSRVGNVIVYSPGFGKGHNITPATKAELHYYKRLPALDALYDVTPANFTAGYLTTTAGTTYLYNVTSAAATKYATHAEAVTADATKATGTAPTGSGLGAFAFTNLTGGAGHIVVGDELSGTGIALNSSTGAPPKVAGITYTGDNTTANITLGTNDTQSLTGQTVTFSSTTSTKYIGTEIAHWLRDENEKILLYGALSEAFYYLQDDDQAAKYQKLFYEQIGQLNDEDNKRSSSGGNIQINYSGRGLI